MMNTGKENRLVHFLNKYTDESNIGGKVISYLAPILFLVAGYIYDLRYLIKYGRMLLDADMASEMVLADMLNQSGGIITNKWVYSTEIRVFETQWFYRLGLLLFPGNWHAARVLAMALMLALLAVGIVLVGKAADWKQYRFWAAGFAMWPLGFWYCFQSTFGGYYLPYAIFSSYSLACILAIMKTEKAKVRCACYAFLGVLAFMSGMNGVRQMMVMYAPVFCAAVLLKLLKKGNILGPAIWAVIFNLGGYAINALYLAKHYQFLQEGYAWGGGTGSWGESIKWFVEAFGYYQIYVPGERNQGILLFSMNGIAAGCGLLIGYMIAAGILYLLKNYRKLNEKDTVLFTVCLFMFFIITFVFTYLFGGRQYWQQTMAFAFLTMVMAARYLEVKKENIKTLLLCMVAVLTIISAKGTVSASIEKPLRAELGMTEVVEWIEKNTDYEKGMADFWISNLVMELSDGKLEMYTVHDAYNPTALNMWLQNADHEETVPTSHYFVIARYSDNAEMFSYLIDEMKAQQLYDDGKYVVFGIK